MIASARERAISSARVINSILTDLATVAGDTSARALEQSYGLMVNYLYDLDYIEKNHEAYAQQRAVVAASAISRLVRSPVREVVPVSG